MQVIIQSIHLDIPEELKNQIEEQLGKLPKFWDRLQKAEVTLKIDKDGKEHENNIIEVQISAPNHTFFAEAKAEYFKKGLDLVFDKLKKQIRRHKEKLQTV